MKIAIQGHLTRGKEVIKILRSLGGINTWNYLGNNFDCYYEIHGNTIICACTKSVNYKYYTLEEFEKEFPFKVGDVVQTKPCGEPAKIIRLYPNPACTIAYKVRYTSGVEMQYSPDSIKFYKEMKEERNVTLTLEKAKEWYNKGGELKEIALQAFSEKELNPLPRSWGEFCDKYFKTNDKEYFIGINSNIVHMPNHCRLINADRNICPSKKSAEAHLAMIQLEQLRDCWRKGWEPTKCDTGYCITYYPEDYSIMSFCYISFLSFPTRKMAEDFLECFRDLIEKAGDLI